MSIYDWAYAVGYSSPDLAIGIATPYALEGSLTLVGKMQIPIYRVYGGGSSIYGKSYSVFNPNYIPRYRNFAGLPNVNSGEYLLKGNIQLKDIYLGRWFAAPWDGNSGGLPFELFQNYDQLINPRGIPIKKPF